MKSGRIGENYVHGRLLRARLEVAASAEGAPWDLVVTDPQSLETIYVDVKTKKKGTWMLGTTTPKERIIYVFVDIEDLDDIKLYWCEGKYVERILMKGGNVAAKTFDGGEYAWNDDNLVRAVLHGVETDRDIDNIDLDNDFDPNDDDIGMTDAQREELNDELRSL